MKNLLEYKNYRGTVEFSAEDEVFFGKINGIRDVVTFEADSVAKLKKAFKEAVEDYIETCKKSGKDIDKVVQRQLQCTREAYYPSDGCH